jgi:hypothetical protein
MLGDCDELRAVSLLSLGSPFQVGEAESGELTEEISPAPTHREGAWQRGWNRLRPHTDTIEARRSLRHISFAPRTFTALLAVMLR